MHEREYFETLCNTADGVFIVDGDQHILRWNKGAEKILKFSESEVLSRECFQVMAGKASPGKIHCKRNCAVHSGMLVGECQKNFDLLTHAKDGEPLWINISFISSPNPNLPFLVHILRDITREKNTERAVHQFLADLSPRSLRAEPDKPIAQNASLGRPAAILSEREIEVLTLLAEGLTTKALAQKLDISHFTARNHIQNILGKLNLHSKAQAVSYAFKTGIL
jgi:PAS domain S-box-containing protein